MNHFEAIKKARNAGACEVCGSSTYWRCAVCKKYMCLFNKHNWTGGKCAFLFHSEKYFGLSRSDYLDVVGKGWYVRMEVGKIMKISKGNLLIGNRRVTLP